MGSLCQMSQKHPRCICSVTSSWRLGFKTLKSTLKADNSITKFSCIFSILKRYRLISFDLLSHIIFKSNRLFQNYSSTQFLIWYWTLCCLMNCHTDKDKRMDELNLFIDYHSKYLVSIIWAWASLLFTCPMLTAVS